MERCLPLRSQELAKQSLRTEVILMADISKIKALDGVTYDVKDTVARTAIDNIQDDIESIQNSIPNVERITNADIDSLIT